MKLALVAFLFLGCAAVRLQGSEPAGESRIGSPAVEVLWAAPTNGWPDALWIYKVVPQDFSDAVVSNLLALAFFTERDRTRPPVSLRETDWRAFCFSNRDETKHLAVYPSLGWIDYSDEKAASASQLQPVVGVPDQTETTRLGVESLRLVGVDISQIAVKPGSSDLDLHWERRTIEYTDQQSGRTVTLTNRFTVFFRRRIDGINVGGIALNGGVVVGFGNHGKVAELQVYWRNLKPHELRRCVAPDQIVEWLRTGRLALPVKAGPPSQITKLTVNIAVPYYDSKFGDEPESFVVPKVDMVATAERPGGPVTFQFQAPILQPNAKAK